MNTKTIIFVVIAVVILGGLFIALKPKDLPTGVAVQDFSKKTFEIVVSNKKIISETSAFSAKEGDRVTMKFTLDQDEEVHLHGYDKSVQLKKDMQGELTFTANLTGRFPFELEGSSTELGVLEVLPK